MTEVKSIHDIILDISPYYKEKGSSDSSHSLIYDSSSETLEPIYFYLLDLMNDMGLSPEKLEDNFISTPGSGHFSELGQKASLMQQQASKLLGDANTVIKSILNIVYDLRDFKLRLQQYDSLKSKDENEKEAAYMSLKQIWMDKVDISKGNSSIKAMTFGQSGFELLIDAFLKCKTEKEVDSLDLNDRVKRAVKGRIQEFNIWLQQSELELRKRYVLEKTYLKSQMNSLKLYSQWARPYLKAAKMLEQKESNDAALVKTFNTIILELTLFGKMKLDLKDEFSKNNIPEFLLGNSKWNNRFYLKNKVRRDYFSCTLVNFSFRGIPQKISQQGHYTFGGKTKISFESYALNSDEINKLKEELKKAEYTDALELVEGVTTESLEVMINEINSFLNEKDDEEKKDKKEKNDSEKSKGGKDESNPFLALFGRYEKDRSNKKVEDKNKKEDTIAPDNDIEKEYLRALASENAKLKIFEIFDLYKKSHGMPSYT